jgi:enamidase
MSLADALKLKPHILAHANGGSTARSDEEMLGAVEQMDAYMEACFHGGLRQMFLLANALSARGQLHRLILGTDSPTAVGIVPQAIFRMVSWLSGLTDLTVGQAIAAGSGNTQQAFQLETGTLTEGAVADILVVDAPNDSFAADATQALKLGDMVAVTAILQDGMPMEGRALNTPYPNRPVTWHQGKS